MSHTSAGSAGGVKRRFLLSREAESDLDEIRRWVLAESEAHPAGKKMI
jgi:plasmid stabilization system protein ParE